MKFFKPEDFYIIKYFPEINSIAEIANEVLKKQINTIKVNSLPGKFYVNKYGLYLIEPFKKCDHPMTSIYIETNKQSTSWYDYKCKDCGAELAPNSFKEI